MQDRFLSKSDCVVEDLCVFPQTVSWLPRSRMDSSWNLEGQTGFHELFWYVKQDEPDLVDDLQVTGVPSSAVSNQLHEVVSPPAHLVHGVLGCISLLVPLHTYTGPSQIQVNEKLMQDGILQRADIVCTCHDSPAMFAKASSGVQNKSHDSRWLY